jgi:hypothetical protein
MGFAPLFGFGRRCEKKQFDSLSKSIGAPSTEVLEAPPHLA